MTLALILAITLTLAFTALATMLLLAALGRLPHSRRGHSKRTVQSGYELSTKSTTYLGGPSKVPFSQRAVTLKVCAACGELIVIAASTCRYCQAAQSGAAAPVASPTAEVPLRLPRKRT